MTLYNTFSKYGEFSEEFFKNAMHTSMNKPMGGLWGCRGDEWKDWCEENSFARGKTRFLWELDKSAKVLEVHSLEDYKQIARKYHKTYYSQLNCLDFDRIMEEYDAMEIFDPATYDCRCVDHILSLNDGVDMGLYTWDVPSIVVFRKDKIRIKESIWNNLLHT